MVGRSLILRFSENRKRNGDVYVWGAGPVLGAAAPTGVVATPWLACSVSPGTAHPMGEVPSGEQEGALVQGHLLLALGPWGAGHGMALAPGLLCSHLCLAPQWLAQSTHQAGRGLGLGTAWCCVRLATE